jgi:tetratricopeptide (TPR) repeat protein
MGNLISTREWLLLLLAAMAYVPGSYVVRHVAASPARRDITLPPEDLSWRTRKALARNLGLLAILCAIAVFIYTPTAVRLASMPSFWPLLIVAMGAWVLVSVAKSFVTGSVEPLTRGWTWTFTRVEQTKRYWLSLLWNATWGGLMLWLGVTMAFPSPDTRCRDVEDRLTPQEQVVACDAAIAAAPTEGLAGLFAARAYAKHRMGEEDAALSDYDKAIERDPNDSYALYNRALIYQHGEQNTFAIEDFTRSIALRRDNAEAFLNRGRVYFSVGRLDEARRDFTECLVLDPAQLTARALRGVTYVLSGENSRALQDFAAVRARAPDDADMLRGEALLQVRQGDLAAAERLLRGIVAKEPGDQWSQALLAHVYRKLGRDAEAEAIDYRLRIRPRSLRE